MDSIPTGTDPLSKAQAVEALLEATSEQAPVEESNTEEIQVQEEPEIVEEVEAIPEEDQAEAETDDVSEEIEETAEEEVLYSVNVDGEEYDVNSEELIKNYQIEKTAQKRLSQAAEARKVNEAKEAELEQERIKYSTVLQQMEQQLSQPPISEVELNNLKETDPMAYYEKRDQIREHQTQLAAVKQEQEVVKARHLATQHEKLVDLIPEWKNVETATKEKTSLVGYLKTQGFSDQDINAATDARIVNMARKAQLFDNLQSKKAVIKKKVNAAPKMIKSGQPKGNVDVKEKARVDAWKKLQKSGRKEDAVNYLLNK